MSQRKKRDGIYIAVSSLKNIIVGEQSCEWASWFKANFRDFEQAPSDFDGVSWKIKHTRLLRDIRIEEDDVRSLFVALYVLSALAAAEVVFFTHIAHWMIPFSLLRAKRVPRASPFER